MARLSHLDRRGRAVMVDVGEKPVTAREATARAAVKMRPEAIRLILNREIPKGDVFSVAKIAGILAAKRVDELIPLCHSLPLDRVDIDFEAKKDRVVVTASVRTHSRTGVEMEALTAAATACLTIYDMCKSLNREMAITDICLLEKKGGRSGHFVRRNEK